MNKSAQLGFTLIEIVVGIIAFAILATGLLSIAPALYKGSSTELASSTMESVARSAFDQVFSAGYPPTNTQYILGIYSINITTSTNTSTTCTAGCIHVKVAVGCQGCSTTLFLSGDDYNVF